MFGFFCSPFKMWPNEIVFDFPTYLQYINVRQNIVSTDETVAYFVLCYPLVFHWFTDSERVRTLYVLRTIIQRPVFGIDLNEHLGDELETLHEYAKACVDAFFASGKTMQHVNIPTQTTLALIPRSDVPLPSDDQLRAVLQDCFRLGSKSARANLIEAVLAFAMGTHPRLGENFIGLNFGAVQPEIIHHIMRLALDLPVGSVG